MMDTIGEGTILSDRYRLDAELGRGGKGVVYGAQDTLLNRDVAIKILHESHLVGLDTEGRTGLLSEAQSAAQLNHPNIVTVYDVNDHEGTLYVVMERVEGKPLSEYQIEGQQKILSVTKQICAALEHAHAHEIVHRDLKPENIMLLDEIEGGRHKGTGEGLWVKLVDFGLARSVAARLTTEGIVGTVFYLAPEQALGQDIDQRTDLYSLGVILYELTTGHLPFTGDDPLSLISQHIHAPVVPPRAHNAEIPPALEDLILDLLSKSPSERPESAAVVMDALEKISDAGLTAGKYFDRQAPFKEYPHNLPVMLTSFIGREQEIGEILEFFAPFSSEEERPVLAKGRPRLLTLTGPGGTGKTRLAIECAYQMFDSFKDGIWLVDLASQSDPALVPQAIASVLGVHEQQNRPLLATLADHLRSRQALLILDSCEHLVEVCAQVAEYLLTSCLSLCILATSREALSIPGELNLQLCPLSLPDCEVDLTIDEFKQFEAVQLFIERAQGALPGFTLTERNLAAVGQVCCHLDGIPLAIELAAAQVKMLRVEQISDRLGDRFRLLLSARRTALPRQQTLRALIDWSYDLLSESERILTCRLSVFVGGWTIEAAEAICADSVGGEALIRDGLGSERVNLIHPADVLNLLTQLVNKSIVVVGRRLGEDSRYRYLETIRQYAHEKAIERGNIEVLQRRHRDWYLDYVECAEAELRGVKQAAWLEKLELEHDNIRSALRWTLEKGVPEKGLQSEEVEAGLRMVGALWRFWDTRGYVSEGRKWLDCALESNHLRTTVRVKALIGAGELAIRQSDVSRGLALFEESLALSHELGYRPGVAETLFCMQLLAEMEEWTSQKKEALIQESLGIWREIGDRRGIATALGPLASMALERFDYDQATALFEESLGLFRELGDEREIAGALWNLGEVTLRRGDYTRAQIYYQESLALYQILKDKHGIATQMRCLGEVARNQRDLTEANKLFEESVPIFQELGDKGCQALAMHGLGLAALNRGDGVRAIQLGEEVLAAFRELDWKMNVALALDLLGRAYYTQGDIRCAKQLFEEGLNSACEIGHASLQISFLEGLARVAHAGGNHRRAAQLFGAAHAWREAINTPMPAGDQAEFDGVVMATREYLSQQVFAQEWKKGEAMFPEYSEKIFELTKAADNLID